MSGRRPQLPGWWYGDATPPLHAQLLSQLYGAAIGVRAVLYRSGIFRRRSVQIPVIVVGNLTAGGTGKTPLTIAIIERLRAAGWHPGVASRGYGRSDPSQALWVDAKSDPVTAGDEPVLIARRSGAKVRVDRDRFSAARALAEAGCDIVICDDGLQHYGLVRDIEIEVIDGARRYGNGRLLPAGPLREPVARGKDCDFRVVNLAANVSVTGSGDHGFGEWPMRLPADMALPLLGGRPRPLSAFVGQRVHAVAGIGHPERFFAMLRELGVAVVPHAFADHHRYVAEDFQFGSDLPVLMTEKDAVKCIAFANERSYSVPIRAELPEAFWIALQHRLPPRKGGVA